MPESVGRLYVPAAWGSFIADGRPWAVDNGAFAGFDEASFWALLGRLHKHRTTCLFVAAPDVVGDARATLRLFAEWQPVIARMGFPVALVGQDGLTMDMVPWDCLDAVFLGGSTGWKLGHMATTLAGYGNARGKWVHMGRVNSRRRIRHAHRIGCQSIDGSGWSKWPAIRLPMAVDWMRNAEASPCLF
jgi:hypothetical protein